MRGLYDVCRMCGVSCSHGTECVTILNRAALAELRACGVSIGASERKIEHLDWFVGGDAGKIRRLQQKLNELGVGERLTEDGVFGAKTLAAWNKFKEILSGSVPTLGFIDPLQPNVTGYRHILADKNRPRGRAAEVYNVDSLPKKYKASVILNKPGHKGVAFMLDHPHIIDGGIEGYHMNVHVDVPPQLQKYFYNHKEITESTYLKLHNFKNVAKPIRIAGRVVLVMGIVLDAVELGMAVYEDVKDSDNFPEKETVSTALEIGGRWTGAALGAKGGAMLGATIGTTIAPVLGTAIGGVVGGLIGGIAGSYALGAIAEYAIDVTWAEG